MAGTVQIAPVGQPANFTTLPIETPAIATLNLNGLDGDDVFNVTGTLPYGEHDCRRRNPWPATQLNLSGATVAVAVNLADSTLPTDTTITGYGSIVTLIGVEVANLNVDSNALTVYGTAESDNITYTPTGPNAGTFALAGLNTVFNFTNGTGAATGFAINGGIHGVGNDGVADQVIVQGTTARDLFEIDQGKAARPIAPSRFWPTIPTRFNR